LLNKDRKDVEATKNQNPLKWQFCLETNRRQLDGGTEEALKGADVVIATSAPKPGIIRKEWIQTMAKDPIVFACANPLPEIWPWDAKEGGAAVVATGRSDFPNQVNNSLCFPAIFRGTLDVRARTITDEMCFAAAEALAAGIGERLDAEHILPDMSDRKVFQSQAAAVGTKAVVQGIARNPLTYEELFFRAGELINRSQEMTKTLMTTGLIPSRPS
jgi:malate dehydrogenase (oxaloacetate-decarboxylating)